MGLLSTIVGGAFSLFGANKARKDEQAAINRQNAYNHPKAIRARAEEAGVHPSVFFGPGVGNQTAVGGTNYMGAAIADAGLMVADQLSKNSAAQKLERTERLNSKLQQQVTDLTIRPKVGGIYDQRVGTPTVRQALGVEDGGYVAGSSPSGQGANNSPPIGSIGLEPDLTSPDEARPVDVKNTPNSGGFLQIENILTGGRPIYMFGEEVEASEAILQSPSLAAQIGWNWGKKAGEAAKHANGGLTPGERVRGKDSSKSGKGRAREFVGMFPTLGSFPNPWFDQPLKYRSRNDWGSGYSPGYGKSRKKPLFPGFGF